jgi:hypothetical protein
LTELRVVLPGAQALFGFQFAAVLTESFTQLPVVLKGVHLASLSVVAAAVVMLIAPAAYHRIAAAGNAEEGVLRRRPVDAARPRAACTWPRRRCLHHDEDGLRNANRGHLCRHRRADDICHTVICDAAVGAGRLPLSTVCPAQRLWQPLTAAPRRGSSTTCPD